MITGNRSGSVPIVYRDIHAQRWNDVRMSPPLLAQPEGDLFATALNHCVVKSCIDQ
jgi:hypothetical protein